MRINEQLTGAKRNGFVLLEYMANNRFKYNLKGEGNRGVLALNLL